MSAEDYKLIWTVLESHLEVTKKAVFNAGAGSWENGKYVQVAFETLGKGQFMPVSLAGAAPHTGAVDKLAITDEVRVEVLCQGKEITRRAVDALKKAHPYEVVALEVYKLENF